MQNKLNVVAFYQKRKKVIWVSLLVLIFCYGYRLFNFSITLDNDIDLILAQQNPGENLNLFFFSNGRYLMGIMRYLFSINGAFVPYASVFIGLVALWLSTIVLCIIIDNITDCSQHDITFIAFISLFLSSPIPFAQTFAFDSTIDVGYIFVLIMNIGIYHMIIPSSSRKNAYVYGVALLLISFLSNQYTAMLYISSFAMLLFVKIITTKDIAFNAIWKFSKPFVINGMISLLGYGLATVLIRSLLHIDSSYLNSLVGWVNASFIDCLRAIKSSIFDLISWDKAIGSQYFTLMLISIAIVIGKISFMGDRPLRVKIYTWIAAFLLVASIFSLSIALGSKIAIRQYVGVPYFMGIAALVTLIVLKKSKCIRPLFLLLLTFIFIRQGLTMNLSFYSTYQTAELEKIYIHQIAHDIMEKNNGEMPTSPVIFIGNYSIDPPSMIHQEAVGSRMLAWYEPERKYNAFKVYGYQFNSNLVYDTEANDEAKMIASSMHNWPADDSIYIGDEFIVVKFSGPTYIFSKESDDSTSGNSSHRKSEGVNSSMAVIEQNDNECFIYGWAYIPEADSSYTKMSMEFVGSLEKYTVPLVAASRHDVDKVFNSGQNGLYDYSGIDARIPLRALPSGKYKLVLLLSNGDDSYAIDLNYECNVL